MKLMMLLSNISHIREKAKQESVEERDVKRNPLARMTNLCFNFMDLFGKCCQCQSLIK